MVEQGVWGAQVAGSSPVPPTKECKKCHEKYEPYGQKLLMCKPCRTIYNREYYHQKLNKPKMMETKKKRVVATRQAVFNYLKEHPCSECGEADPKVLEFDHLDRTTKSYNVSEMMGLSIAKIEQEVLKCRVLCANCHRRHTAEQMGWYAGLE